MVEKRLYHRLLIDTEILQHNVKDDNATKGKAKDISVGGICITTEGEPLRENDVYILSFRLPGDDEKLEVSGRVVWTKNYKAGITDLYDNGIEFLDPEKEFIDVLEDFSIGAIEG
jgi:Tfp pilus assembly protein PilZ